MKTIFVTGGTGYIGKRVIRILLDRRYRVISLVRKGSETRVPAGSEALVADPLNADSFQYHVPVGSVFIQLLGVPHPSPKKALLFKQIDLVSVRNSVAAATYANVSHFIYVSVAMEPTSVMKAYQDVRKEGESCCIQSGLPCTFIRPWYVLGPGHWWPVLLTPIYLIARLFPSLRAKATAFGLITIGQMVRALVKAIETTPVQLKIIEIPDMKRS